MDNGVSRTRRVAFLYVSIALCFAANLWLAVGGIDTLLARAVVDGFSTYMILAALTYVGASVSERAGLVSAAAARLRNGPKEEIPDAIDRPTAG